MEISPGVEDAASVDLTPDEAIVLFELLSRWSETAKPVETPAPSCFESTAEVAVLNRLLCQLEAQLVAPFKGDYSRLLMEARERLASDWSHSTLRG